MTGGVWVASYVAPWLAVVVLGLAVVALLRQVGVLHARLRPVGVHFAGEGPKRLAPAPADEVFDYGAAELNVVAFTSPTCTVCAELRPGLAALEAQYADVAVHLVDHSPVTAPTFAAFNVTSTPYVVGVGRDGVVRARGVANTLEQVELMVEEALSKVRTASPRPETVPGPEPLPRGGPP